MKMIIIMINLELIKINLIAHKKLRQFQVVDMDVLNL
jgi:hypothetical protein